MPPARRHLVRLRVHDNAGNSTFRDAPANAAVGEELGFVMTTCPTCGEVKIIGSAPGAGSHSFTVNLHSATTHPSVRVAREFGHDGNLAGLYPTTATIEVVSKHKPVVISGFGSVMSPQCACIWIACRRSLPPNL